MNTRLLKILVIILAAANVVLLWQARTHTPSAKPGDHLASTECTYPRFGTYALPVGASGTTAHPTLTLAIFCSAKSDCPARDSEYDIFRKLVSVFNSRNQHVIVATTIADSARIAFFIDSVGLHVPIVAYDSSSSLSLEQIGISYLSMPAKILYDSSLVPIYMRTGDPTPESQADFENAMLWLSKLYAEGSSSITATPVVSH